MFRNGNEDFPGHVSTLLRPWCLVLDMDACCTLLDEHLSELEDSGEATVSGVGVGDDGAEVVDVSGLGGFGRGEVGAGFALLAVMEELGLEEVLYLVWHGVGRVI